MKKIPTLFVRDRKDRSRVTSEVTPGCRWVYTEDEGVAATEKVDGTCCLVRGGLLYKRREVKPGKPDPEGFELSEEDPTTGKRFGWVPCARSNPADRWHFEALDGRDGVAIADGTYELVGPKVQGNPYGYEQHMLLRHGGFEIADPPYPGIAELSAWLAEHPVEGIVWHHPDGRMAKIKRRDFGLPWPVTKGSERC